MKTVCNFLSKNIFFKDVPKEIIYCILNSSICFIKKFGVRTKIFESNIGNCLFGIVMEGKVDIICISAKGDESIVSRFMKGMNFWHSHFSIGTNVCTCVQSSPNSEILFVNINRLMSEFSFIDEHREVFLRNIATSLVEHNVLLNAKIHIMSQKTLRDKLLTYVEFLCDINNTFEVTLPFNREQLACFLNSERSSVCRELSKLESDKIIKIKKNNIVFLPRVLK